MDLSIDSSHGSRSRFLWVKAPTSEELTQLTHTIAYRVARYLERQGWLVRDASTGYLTAKGVDADPDSPLNQLLGSSITYRIAVGPQQGRKVFTLQTLPDCRADNPCAHTVGKVALTLKRLTVTVCPHGKAVRPIDAKQPEYAEHPVVDIQTIVFAQQDLDDC